ncbi:MAG: hypothetical protein U0791_24275 [Gemmataceae bacterium]
MLISHDVTLPNTPETQLHAMARRLAAGEEIDTEALVIALAAAGKGMSDLHRLCERFGAELEARRTVLGDLVLPTFPHTF